VSVIVTVAGQSGPSIVATNGDTVAVTVSPAGATGPQGTQGPAGPANTLTIGTVTSGTAAATITGTAPSQTLNLVLPVGAKGDTGSKGDAGATGPQGPAGTVNLADETPQPLGTASAGTALSAARADHVHAQGSIAYSGLSGIPRTFAPSAHQHAVGDVTGLQAALDAKQAAGTYATLVSGTVPSSQLPSYVDDVVEYANLAAFPATGEVGKILVARDTGKIYRWSGSAFIEISPSPGSTDSVAEGSTNLYYTNARAAAAAPVQSVAGRTGAISLAKADVGLGNVDNTADASKPVSTAQAAADTAVQSFAVQRANHTGTQTASTISDFATESAKYGPVQSVSGRTGTVTLAKADVGLGNVDNTADASKPVSTAMQTALDGKAATSHMHSLADLTQSSATTGQVPTWNGSAWAAATPSGGGGGSYTLPTATSSVLGGIKVGSGLTITDGVLAATGGGGSLSATVTIPASGDTQWENTLLLMRMDGSAADISPRSTAFTSPPGTFSTTAKYGSNSYNVNRQTGLTSTSKSIPDISTGNWTVEAWVYRQSSTDDYSCIVFLNPGSSASSTGNGGLNLYINKDGSVVQNNGLASSLNGGSVSVGQWVHIAVVMNSGVSKLYVNGTSVATGSQQPVAGPYWANIGWVLPSSPTFAADLLIDELRITKAARYTANFTPPTSRHPSGIYVEPQTLPVVFT
jgi:hypothetical protein